MKQILFYIFSALFVWSTLTSAEESRPEEAYLATYEQGITTLIRNFNEQQTAKLLGQLKGKNASVLADLASARERLKFWLGKQSDLENRLDEARENIRQAHLAKEDASGHESVLKAFQTEYDTQLRQIAVYRRTVISLEKFAARYDAAIAVLEDLEAYFATHGVALTGVAIENYFFQLVSERTELESERSALWEAIYQSKIDMASLELRQKETTAALDQLTRQQNDLAKVQSDLERVRRQIVLIKIAAEDRLESLKGFRVEDLN